MDKRADLTLNTYVINSSEFTVPARYVDLVPIGFGSRGTVV